MKKSNVLWITTTGVLLAILLILQVITKPAGQIITGSLVNMVLALSILSFNFENAIIVASLSPFFAFFLGIGPAFLPLTPAIAAGNIIYILAIYFLSKKNNTKKIYIKNFISIIIASICKYLVLYLLVVQFICKLFTSSLKPQQIKAFSAMFSMPQLITAIIGGTLACLISPMLNIAFNNKEKKKA